MSVAMACQKYANSMQDDINVKLNTRSLTAASFLTLEYNCTIKKCRDRALFIYLHVNTVITTASVFFSSCFCAFFLRRRYLSNVTTTLEQQ